MEATQILRDEHQVIKRVLRVLEQAGRDLAHGKSHPPHLFEQAVDFLRNFADRCHHLKEEEVLFQEMGKAGVPVQGGPIGVMLVEHDQGRALVKGMAAAIPDYGRGEASATKTLAENAQSFSRLLAAHIDKEDNILYPMAEMHLDAGQNERLMQRFEEKEQELGEGVHERYHRLAAELEQAVWGRAPSAACPHH